MSDALTYEEVRDINKVVQAWANKTRRQTINAATGSIKQVKQNNSYNYGLISSAGFKFPRHGVFVEMGVFGGLTRKEAIAQGRLKPKPWFNPVLKRMLPELDEELGEANGKFALNAIENAFIKNVNL